MRIPYYQINSFVNKNLRGNPAGVCLLQEELDEQLMQRIATENNLSETAFVVRSDNDFNIRWFTPSVEVELCGHATLASAYAICEFTEYSKSVVKFISKSGLLIVSKDKDIYRMEFPSDSIEAQPIPDLLKKAFAKTPVEILKGKTDYMLVFKNEQEIIEANPDMKMLARCDGRGVIISAAGKEVDFVSRFFAPQSGIPEDPVTGSAHTSLIPYWFKQLGKVSMLANQLSQRGGEIQCKYLKDKVEIAGKAELYIQGYIHC